MLGRLFAFFSGCCMFSAFAVMSGYEISLHVPKAAPHAAAAAFDYQSINAAYTNIPADSCRFIVFHAGAWQSLPVIQIPRNITLAEAINMVKTREAIIQVSPAFLQSINNLQAAGALPANAAIYAAALASPINVPSFGGGQFGAMVNYVKRSFLNGGYNMFLSKVIWYLKSQNILINLMQNNIPANQIFSIVFHVALFSRVSKNMKELIKNSRTIGIQVPGGGFIYNSLKDKLNLLGYIPSATVVTYTND